jgi:hypothetical protein
VFVPWALFVANAIIGPATAGTLPPALRSYSSSESYSPVLVVFALTVMLVSIWNTYELFQLRPRAWSVYAAILILGYLSAPLLPPVVQSGIAGAAINLQPMASGALLAVLYWSPVAARFEAPVHAA